MLAFTKAPEVVHVILKLTGLALVFLWLYDLLKELRPLWKWETTDDKVRYASIAIVIAVLLYSALYSQAVPW
jgi:hypothetical protein